MKFLGIDTEGVRLIGKFTFTNTAEFPVVVSVWQTSPLYYRVLSPGETWSTDCGSVWFTVKAWLYNGENNINPGIKYSLLAGNIVGFAALGALGLGASALASQYGVSARNPDWEEWVLYNGLASALDDAETIKGLHSIGRCEFSQAGYYAGKHPHLYVSGGPVRRYASGREEKGGRLTLEWHEIRVDKCAYANDALPRILVPETRDFGSLSRPYTDEDEHQEPTKINRYAIGDADDGWDGDDGGLDHDDDSSGHRINLVDYEDADPPRMPQRPSAGNPKSDERPAMPPRPPSKILPSTVTSPSLDEKFEYKINH